MKLIELRLKNLNSLKGEWYVDFSDPELVNAGIFAITGQTGAGKTTLLDAICLALYGKTPRIANISKTTNEVMTRQTGECFAEVVIDITGKQYRCRWGQRRAYNKPSGNLQDATHELSQIKPNSNKDVLLESKLTLTQRKIVDVLGMDFNQFTRSIMLAQGSFAAFLQAGGDERADILEKITGIDIYASISVRVHDNRKQAEQTLSDLQTKAAAFELLDVQQEEALQSQQTKYEQDIGQLTSTLNQVTDQLTWLNKQQDLIQRHEQSQQSLQHATQAWASFEPDAIRLNLAHKALELAAPFEQLNTLKDRVEQQQRQREQLTKQLNEYQNQLDHHHSQLADAQRSLDRQQKMLTLNLPNLKTARQLDIACQQKQEQIDEWQRQQAQLQEDIKRMCAEGEQLANTKDALHKKRDALDAYLAQHASDSALSDILLRLAHLSTRYHDQFVRLDDHRQQLTANQLDISKHEKQLATLNDETRKHNQHVAQLTCEYDQQNALVDNLLAGTTFKAHQNDVQAKQRLAYQFEQTHEQHMAQWTSIHQQCHELTALAVDIDELTSQRTHIDTQIKQQARLVTELCEQQQDKAQLLSLRQDMAVLQDYVHLLTKDDPCPLCGSVTHPAPLMTNDEASDAPSKLETLKQSVEQLGKRLAAAQSQLDNSRVARSGLQGSLEAKQGQALEWITRLKHAGAQLNKNLLANQDYSTHMQQDGKDARPLTALSDITAQLDKLTCSEQADQQNWQSVIVRAEQLSAALATLRSQLQACADHIKADYNKQQHAWHQLELQHEALQSTRQKLDDCRTEQQQHDTLVQSVATATKQLYKQQTQIHCDHKKHAHALLDTTDQLMTLLQPYQPLTKAALTALGNIKDCSPQGPSESVYAQCMSTLRQVEQDLAKRRDAHADTLTQQQSVNTQLEHTTHKLAWHRDAVQQKQHTHREQQRQLEEQQARVACMQRERQALFNETDLDALEQHWHDAMQNDTQKVSHIKQAIANQQYAIQQTNKQLEEIGTNHTADKNQLSQTQTAFKQMLKDQGFTDDSKLLAAQLSSKERSNLTQQHTALQQRLQTAQSTLATVEAELQTHEQTPAPTDCKATLNKKQTHTQRLIDEYREALGSIKQQLAANRDKKSLHHDLQVLIDKQHETLATWQRLHQLIGSSDGKKYRNFAQGLTFDIMIAHANKQLDKMSDRYVLVRSGHTLDLDVLDNYQGGERRTTKNLSGGEGFIISLALALGLSSMASQQTGKTLSVDSLFLDEGFGTLDADSLDTALSVLTSLQQNGKVIGIISHVSALKERILTQIKVSKQSGGHSVLQGAGCHQIKH